MNIGIVTTWFERGAAHVSRQYRDVLNENHNVSIYARGGESYATADPLWNTNDVTWGKRLPSNIPTIICLVDFEKWIRQHKIELIIFNEQWWWPAVALANRQGIITGAYIDYYTEQTVPFFGAYDFLICNTLRHLSAFDWHPGAMYVPWGTDIQVFTPTTKLPPKIECLTFFHSAGISPRRKGTDLLLLAFDNLDSLSRLVIHSQRRLAELLPEHAALITKLQNEDRLVCHEKTVPSPGLFHLGDVYVYPTRLEGIGLTIMEAAACGLPVIVTNAPPMNEFIHHGENGRLIPVALQIARPDGYLWPQAIADVAGLQEQMQWYLDNNSHIEKLKVQARRVAEQNFDWKKTAAPLLKAIGSTKKNTNILNERVEKDIFDYTIHQRNTFHQHPFQIAKKLLSINLPLLAKNLAQLKQFFKKSTDSKLT